MKPFVPGIAVAATSMHCGKTTVCTIALEMFPNAVHYETGRRGCLDHDRLYGTDWASGDESRLRNHAALGEFLDRQRLRDPAYTVRNLPNIPGLMYLASGIRHHAEADLLRERGYWLIKIATTDATDRKRLTPAEYSRQQSTQREQAMRDYLRYHVVINNNGSLAQFEGAVCAALHEIRSHGRPPQDWHGKTFGI